MLEPKNLKVEDLSKSVKWAPHSEQATGHGMYCREILFTPRCSPRAREYPGSGRLFCMTYGCGATGRQSCLIFGFWPLADYIQTMLISLQGAEWHSTKLHTGLMCAGVNCFYPLCSPLRGSWRPGRPSYQTTSREPSIQRRRSCGMEQFAAGHSYCINTVYFQKSSQDSSVFGFVSIINLISSSVCCTVPL